MAKNTKDAKDAKGGKKGGSPGKKGAPQPKTAKAPAAASPRARASDMPVAEKAMARIGTPRMQKHFEETVRPRLVKEFGLKNPNMVPRITKIVLNVGLGEASKNPRLVDAAVEELGIVTGQKAVITRAKKAIANFGLRAGMPVGATVTLRGARMYEFLDRFITLTVPRIRDFRGLPTKSFDGRGNYTFGIKEQMIFPEIDFDKVETVHGMDITLVTTAGRDDLAMALLRAFGWPFKGETPDALRVA
ncbi:MAG: 50S ribosomal protein L5 [Gemmatimonadales bacterium]|nr:50S ribosomal protein L5 [Gemmatimonadales bacterium]